MNKITTINGIFLANQNDVNEHFENAAFHVTQEERTAWNDKADRTSFASQRRKGKNGTGLWRLMQTTICLSLVV